MLKPLFLALNVRPNEERQVLLLLGKGFFMGIFLATYQITAETVFLDRLGDTHLRQAMFTSGIMGVFTTAMFAYFQNRVSYSKLAVLNLVLVFLFTLGIYMAMYYTGPAWIDYFVFAMFVMTTPIMAVILLGFWGVFGRMFDLRQSKRIIGGIDVGQILAAILASFSVPFISRFIPETLDLLLISCSSVLLSLFFLFIITRRYNIDQNIASHRKEIESDASFQKLSKDSYVLLLSAFLGLSMITFTFVDYSFKEVIQDQYQDQGRLRNFLGIFNGSVLILSLVLQTFINDKIIADYGLKAPLLILPFIVGLFTLTAIFVGHYFGYNVMGNGTGFFWFFLFISLSKLFNASLREAMEAPSFKLYFMPLDVKIRFDIQAKVEGVVNEMARLLAGILILALPLLSFFERLHYSYTLLIFIGLYFLIIGKLHNQYRHKIKQKLEGKDTHGNMESNKDKIIRKLQDKLPSAPPNKAIFSFKLLEKIEPMMMEPCVNLLMKHSSEDIRDFAQAKINEIKGLSTSDRYIIPLQKERKGFGRYVIEHSDLDSILSSGGITKRRIEKLSRSADKNDRQYAAELIGNFMDNLNSSHLMELLQDSEPKVRFAAIKSARKKYNNEILHILIDTLSSPVFSNAAISVLIAIGTPSLTALDTAFYRTSQDQEVMLKIIRIFGDIGGEEAISLLWNKIDYPDRIVVSQILLALGECQFKADEKQASRIKFVIESDISDISWNLAALGELPEGGVADEIRDALYEENENDIRHIYMLLGMIYDNKSVQLVRENIESKLQENITYAIELLDVFLSDDLKQKIISILDDLSPSEKFRKLEIYFPRERLEPYEMLKNIINRDFNQSSRWPKACALYQIGLAKISKYEDHLIANLFNPDRLIREAATWALLQIGPDKYHQHTKRLCPEEKSELDEVLIHHEVLMRIQKVFFLKSTPLFAKVPGLVIAKIVDYAEELHLKEGESYFIKENYIGFFHIIYKGEINLYDKRRKNTNLHEKEFVGELFDTENDTRSNFMVAMQDTVLFKISKERFYELLSIDTDFAKKIISNI